MIYYQPLTSLLLFFAVCLILYWFFRKDRGWYWVITNNRKLKQKTVQEDILKQIYHAGNSGNNMTISGLSGILKRSDKTIYNAVEKLSGDQLIRQVGEFFKLTEAGREYSLRIVRMHRLYEKYLAEKTGFSKTEWHGRAEAMEHILSDKQAAKLVLELGDPLFDPHGDPIPTKSGKIAEIKGVDLSMLPAGSFGIITHIEDEPEVIYRQILSENIQLGSQIKVLESGRKGVVFSSVGEIHTLPSVVASNITINTSDENEYVDEQTIRLTGLKDKEKAVIVGVSKESRGESRRRLLDLGFVRGAEISVDLPGPMKNPRAYLIKGTSIALRDDQASKILIKKSENGTESQ
jgi:DtxR family Mn-dependent transcriptional regulator